MASFNEFGLSEPIMANLQAVNYQDPTEVQAKSIPVIMEKKDAVIQSQTGSGKTAAFALPLLQAVLLDVPAVQFLVLVPTRELASQVRNEFAALGKETGVKMAAIYGGADMRAQIKLLKAGAQIVIGTPGRILDHLKRRNMSFSVVRAVVLDEADKMLSMGFLPDVQLIFKHLPKRRQMIMSSATFPISVQRLIHQYMHEPERLLLSSDDLAPKEIEHLYCMLQSQNKEQVLLAFLEKEEPDLSLIFCNTRSDVKSVHYFLAKAGLKVEGLSSDLTQNQREKVLHQLRTGAIQHLVCTDLAARGIDIPELSHVFNYSSSNDSETYVHRIGRTGRAGRSGKAISLVAGHDVAGFRTALKLNGIDAKEIAPPTEEEIIAARMESHYRTLQTIDFAKDSDVREEFLRLSEKLTREQEHSLLPLLLEHFLRPHLAEAPPEAPPQEIRESHPPHGHDRRPPRRGGPRGRRGRDDRRGRDHRHRRDAHPRRRGPRDHGGPPDRGHAGPRKPKSFQTVCLGLGRLDGLDVMDIQNILRRQGKARLEDIGEIAMKDHESFINIGADSLHNVLAADGRHFKNFELYISQSPKSLEELQAPS